MEYTEYIVRIIGVRTDSAHLFYISNSLQDWITDCRADAAVYDSIDAAKSAISQGIGIIKRDLKACYRYELAGVQIVKKIVLEDVIQTLNPPEF